VSAEVAGAFINLEPLVGAAAGALLFGDPVGVSQAIGGAAILAGITLSSLRPERHRPPSDARPVRILRLAIQSAGHLAWRGLPLAAIRWRPARWWEAVPESGCHPARM
jgi:hypothetical protein